MVTRWRLLGLLVVGLLLTGCGRSYYPVKGRVHFADGSPLGNGRVVVESKDGKSASWGAIHSDGTFQMGTNSPTDGVPPGTWQITILNATTPAPADLSTPFVPKPLIHPKYDNKETSGITFEVPAQTEWEITVEKP
jgi:hypothetical protein